MQVMSAKISALMNPVTYIIINGGLIWLIYTGAVRVESGILTQGQLVALVNYMSQILVELVKLANLIITVTKAAACGSRVAAVFQIPAGMNQPVKQGTGRVREADQDAEKEKKAGQDAGRKEAAAFGRTGEVCFDQVSLRYHEGGEEALTDISFQAEKGETIGIIGGTGSGKTSLVHLIPRFYDIEQGSVKVDGRDVRDYELSELRNKIGIVMQKAVLFKGTIRDNLLWGNEMASDEELWQALALAQAKEFVEQKDGKLDAFVEQEGRNLSGGQKK